MVTLDEARAAKQLLHELGADVDGVAVRVHVVAPVHVLTA